MLFESEAAHRYIIATVASLEKESSLPFFCGSVNFSDIL
jgi:hypothetical protein